MAATDQPDVRPVYSVVGDRYVYLVTGRETAGACFVCEAFVPPGGGTPPHVHSREDELFYVIEGEFEFVVAGAPARRTAGGSIFATRGIPHFFRNVGPGPGKMIITVTPAGLEDFFREFGRALDGPAAAPLPPDDEEIRKLLAAAPKYGIEILG